MKIKHINPDLSVNNLKNKESFVNLILQNILTICKEDSNFKVNDKLKKLDEYKKTLDEKNSKLTELLKKSILIKEDFKKQSDLLEEQNLKNKERLLEQLGSTL